MESMLDLLFLFVYLPEIDLEDKGHRVEKKRDIEYCIDHRDNLTTNTMGGEITESDCCCRDHIEVESIEIWPVLSLLKSMDEERPRDPSNQEYDSDDREFLFGMEVKEGHLIL